MSPSPRSIHLLAAGFAAALAAALIVPRFFSFSEEGGFSAASGAALTFVGFGALAVMLALVLFVQTLRGRGGLSLATRLIGYLCLPLFVLGVALLLMKVRSEARAAVASPAKTMTPTAVPTSP